MVTIVDYRKRQRKSGEEFFALILQGGVEFVLSKETGRFYATAKKASMSCTFDEQTCKSLVGSQFPGSVQKLKCDPYEYLVEDTGKVLNLEHRWVYTKEDEPAEQPVHEGKTMEMA